MRFRRFLLLSALLLSFASLPVSAQPNQPDQRTLLLDHLDDAFAPDGVKFTAPAVIKAAGDRAGGPPKRAASSCPANSAARSSFMAR